MVEDADIHLQRWLQARKQNYSMKVEVCTCLAARVATKQSTNSIVSIVCTRAAFPLIEPPFQTFIRDLFPAVGWILDCASCSMLVCSGAPESAILGVEEFASVDA